MQSDHSWWLIPAFCQLFKQYARIFFRTTDSDIWPTAAVAAAATPARARGQWPAHWPGNRPSDQTADNAVGSGLYAAVLATNLNTVTALLKSLDGVMTEVRGNPNI